MTSCALRRRAARTVAGSVLLGAALLAPASAHADDLDDGQWWRASMGVDELHRSGTGKGITVAVIDGPINSSVPELRGRVTSAATPCITEDRTRESPTSSGPDADHATSMAALIVGSGKGTASGGRGIAGIAPDATLKHYAVGFESPYDPGQIYCATEYPDVNDVEDATIAAMRQAVKDGAKVISLSINTSYSPGYAAALLDVYRAGAIVVAATHNERRAVVWPAIGNGVVTVSAVNAKAALGAVSVRGSGLVDFVAPGYAVSTGGTKDGRWRSDLLGDGSSQATALTAGGIAAVWSAHPTATANQVLLAARESIGMRLQDGTAFSAFRREGTNLPRATGKTESYGFGIFSPADTVKVDIEGLPEVNPMIIDSAGSEPSAADVAKAAGASAPAGSTPSGSGAATTGPSPSGSTVSPSPSAPAQAGSPDTGDQAGADDGSSTPLILLALVVLALLAGAALMFFRRRASSVSDTVNHSSTPAVGPDVTSKEDDHGRSRQAP